MTIRIHDLKGFLEEKYDLYNRVGFIENDPISIPHSFSIKEDIEISGFLSAAISWGRRKTIIQNANKLIKLMGGHPYSFIIETSFDHSNGSAIEKFVHRTFNGTDCIYFLKSLQNIYKNHHGLESIFEKALAKSKGDMAQALISFKNIFFELPHPARTTKHISSPSTGAAKRINMFLRWMVRKDKRGVDFGLWENIETSHLRIPLDVHTANTARKLGLLTRRQNDWKAVEELTGKLKQFDANDPVKYDFALFGLGVMEKF